ncbi:hypothetical protein ACIQM0_23190 [Streptomyces sp. NPDC091387]|uniref:hypothetical protein n=1 Tax=Streptomyces sp. NPDC091387 TaxID=3365998 RepID=UPI00380719EA
MTRLRVRLFLAAGAAEIRLRNRLPRFLDAITPHRHRPDGLVAELDCVASDPETRALFRAELDRAIAEYLADAADLTAFMEAAAAAIKAVIEPRAGQRAT